MSEVNKRFQKSMSRREELRDQNKGELELKTYVILSSDPLNSNVYSIG